MIKMEHFACFVPAQAHLQLWIFQLLLSVLQYQFHRIITRSNQVVFYLFQCDWVLFRMLNPLRSVLI